MKNSIKKTPEDISADYPLSQFLKENLTVCLEDFMKIRRMLQLRSIESEGTQVVDYTGQIWEIDFPNKEARRI